MDDNDDRFFFYFRGNDHYDLHSFPTRRSSDLRIGRAFVDIRLALTAAPTGQTVASVSVRLIVTRDRKSTRLNSSHVESSYAVFCLKKKKLNNFILINQWKITMSFFTTIFLANN